MNGCKSITYKIVSLNGEEISKTVLSSDTYKAMDKIIKKGTAKPVENIQQPVIQEQTPVITPEQPTIPEVPNTNTGEQEENNVPDQTIPQENEKEENQKLLEEYAAWVDEQRKKENNND